MNTETMIPGVRQAPLTIRDLHASVETVTELVRAAILAEIDTREIERIPGRESSDRSSPYHRVVGGDYGKARIMVPAAVWAAAVRSEHGRPWSSVGITSVISGITAHAFGVADVGEALGAWIPVGARYSMRACT